MDAGKKAIDDTGKTATDVATAAERLRNVAHEQVDRVSEAVQPAVDRLSAGAHKTIDQVSGVASSAVETVTAKTEQVKELQGKFTEECRQYVQAHPLKALGYAAAIGFVLTRLLRI